MLVFLFGEAKQDVSALGVALAIGEMFVGRGRFDLAPPHLLDGGEVRLVDGHRPRSLNEISRFDRLRRGAAVQFAKYPRRARTRYEPVFSSTRMACQRPSFVPVGVYPR